MKHIKSQIKTSHFGHHDLTLVQRKRVDGRSVLLEHGPSQVRVPFGRSDRQKGRALHSRIRFVGGVC